jgi:hypothetical protein
MDYTVEPRAPRPTSGLIEQQLAPLAELKEAPELLSTLERARQRCAF